MWGGIARRLGFKTSLSIVQESSQEGKGFPDVEQRLVSVLDPDEFKITALLSEDRRATVYKANWERKFLSGASSIIVEVKVLKRSCADEIRTHGSDSFRKQREALAVKHPNVAQLFDSCQQPPFIVTEYCAGGILFDLLHHSGTPLSFRQGMKTLVDVASGMRCLHQHMVLHRDLNSCCVKLTRPISSEKQEPVGKIADFGLSRSVFEHLSQPLTMGIGTWRWTAPEMLAPPEHGEGNYNWSVDVFSYGVLMHEVMARKIPYIEKYPPSKDNDPRVAIKIIQGMRPSMSDLNPGCPQVLMTSMQECWEREPACRPTFEALEYTVREVYRSS